MKLKLKAKFWQLFLYKWIANQNDTSLYSPIWDLQNIPAVLLYRFYFLVYPSLPEMQIELNNI